MFEPVLSNPWFVVGLPVATAVVAAFLSLWGNLYAADKVRAPGWVRSFALRRKSAEQTRACLQEASTLRVQVASLKQEAAELQAVVHTLKAAAAERSAEVGRAMESETKVGKQRLGVSWLVHEGDSQVMISNLHQCDIADLTIRPLSPGLEFETVDLGGMPAAVLHPAEGPDDDEWIDPDVRIVSASWVGEAANFADFQLTYTLLVPVVESVHVPG